MLPFMQNTSTWFCRPKIRLNGSVTVPEINDSNLQVNKRAKAAASSIQIYLHYRKNSTIKLNVLTKQMGAN